MKQLIVIVFWFSLVAFLVAGSAIVLGQLIGVVTGSGEIVAGSAALFNWPAFSLATVCALAAFLLGYFPSERALAPEGE